jgi:hypothetical protein
MGQYSRGARWASVRDGCEQLCFPAGTAIGDGNGSDGESDPSVCERASWRGSGVAADQAGDEECADGEGLEKKQRSKDVTKLSCSEAEIKHAKDVAFALRVDIKPPQQQKRMCFIERVAATDDCQYVAHLRIWCVVGFLTRACALG